MQAIDLTGKKFGLLTALEHVGVKNGAALWRCRCRCGAFCEARSDKLRRGEKTSCGAKAHRAARARDRGAW